MDRRDFLGGLSLGALALYFGTEIHADDAPVAVAWGEPRDGFQVGLFFETSGAAYASGERVAFHLKLKNVSDHPVTLNLNKHSFWMASLNEERVLTIQPMTQGSETVTLQPGEVRTTPGSGGSFLLQQWDGAGKAQESLIRLAPGKYQVRCSGGLWIPDKDDPNRASGLRAAAGTLNLEVKPDGQQPLETRPAPPANGVTWGKPVNGLQTGLRFKDGLNRFKAGDTVEAEMSVRNVSGRPLTFGMMQSAGVWNGNTPAITNGKDEYQPVKVVYQSGFRGYSEIALKPEETAVLGHPTFLVQSADDKSEATVTPAVAVAPGKYRLRLYESCRPDGATFFNLLLATAPLEFEIKA